MCTCPFFHFPANKFTTLICNHHPRWAKNSQPSIQKLDHRLGRFVRQNLGQLKTRCKISAMCNVKPGLPHVLNLNEINMQLITHVFRQRQGRRSSSSGRSLLLAYGALQLFSGQNGLGRRSSNCKSSCQALPRSMTSVLVQPQNGCSDSGWNRNSLAILLVRLIHI